MIREEDVAIEPAPEVEPEGPCDYCGADHGPDAPPLDGYCSEP